MFVVFSDSAVEQTHTSALVIVHVTVHCQLSGVPVRLSVSAWAGYRELGDQDSSKSSRSSCFTKNMGM